MLVRLRSSVIRRLVLPLVATLFSLGTLGAQAGIITPGQAASAEAQVRHLDNVQTFLAREDVRQNLEALGVDPNSAAKRAAQLSPAELAQLSGDIENLPAAGGVLEVLGILLVVLLVLELVGVTDIFNNL
ncbi:MAG: PA2779 family protein [Halieaceae bacterium]|jgi:hypothetical protein|nr:PA2779 family protein [Halieaceae bacterium]